MDEVLARVIYYLNSNRDSFGEGSVYKYPCITLFSDNFKALCLGNLF